MEERNHLGVPEVGDVEADRQVMAKAGCKKPPVATRGGKVGLEEASNSEWTMGALRFACRRCYLKRAAERRIKK